MGLADQAILTSVGVVAMFDHVLGADVHPAYLPSTPVVT
jgi:hypothetical protein